MPASSSSDPDPAADAARGRGRRTLRRGNRRSFAHHPRGASTSRRTTASSRAARYCRCCASCEDRNLARCGSSLKLDYFCPEAREILNRRRPTSGCHAIMIRTDRWKYIWWPGFPAHAVRSRLNDPEGASRSRRQRQLRPYRRRDGGPLGGGPGCRASELHLGDDMGMPLALISFGSFTRSGGVGRSTPNVFPVSVTTRIMMAWRGGLGGIVELGRPHRAGRSSHRAAGAGGALRRGRPAGLARMVGTSIASTKAFVDRCRVASAADQDRDDEGASLVTRRRSPAFVLRAERRLIGLDQASKSRRCQRRSAKKRRTHKCSRWAADARGSPAHQFKRQATDTSTVMGAGAIRAGQ